MKLFIAGCILLVAAVTAKPAGTYTTKYDNIDLDEILNNERLFNNYYNCLKGDGKCTPDGAELKASLPDALKTSCSKCSEKQKNGSEKVFKFLIEKKPEQYAALEKIYDPNGIYKKKYQSDAAKKGIKV